MVLAGGTRSFLDVWCMGLIKITQKNTYICLCPPVTFLQAWVVKPMSRGEGTPALTLYIRLCIDAYRSPVL